MKKILTLALAIGCGVALGQKADNVGIGTTKPDPSALLELNSNSKGFLLPRMTETQRDAIKNPSMGLVIFQTDKAAGTYTFDGTAWQPSNARVGAASSAGAWDKQGNAIDGTDFLGTTNDFPLIFKTAGQRSGYLSSNNSSLFLGFLSGGNSTTGANTGIGFGTLQNLTSGTDNIALGAGTLIQNQSGNYNVAIGNNTLQDNQTGGGNLAIGTFALQKNINGINNIGIGLNSLTVSTTGSYNTAIGSETLKSNESGGINVAIGLNSLNKNRIGNENLAIGINSLYTNTAGSQSVAIGANSGYLATGSRNVFIGYNSGYNETGSDLLYLSNRNTPNPLIKGNFDLNWLKVNSKTAGFLAVGDFDAVNPMPTPTGYRLIVQDGILTEKLKVALRTDGLNWADYVFDPSYKLMPLEEVENYTKANKHLPNVPSADEITKEGIDVAKISKMFMEKIEELTLHVIQLNKRINELEYQNR